MSDSFEVGDRQFRLNPLKVKQALKAEALITSALFPILSAGKRLSLNVDPGDLRSALAGLDRLDELVDIFAARSQVLWQTGPQAEAWVDLPRFLDLVFERRATVLLAWLLECVTREFADFFDGTGIARLADAANELASRLGSTGESGG